MAAVSRYTQAKVVVGTGHLHILRSVFGQHSMEEEEEHVSLCPCSGTTAQYGGGGACVPYVPVVVEEELVSPMSL